MNQPSPGFDSRDEVAQQPVVYAYPPAISARDDIDLGEILINFAKRWKLMAAIVVSGCIASLAFVLSMPLVYQADMTLSLPTAADVSSFKTNGIDVGSNKTLFKRYYDRLRSQQHFSTFLETNDYLSKLFPASQGSKDQLLGLIFDGYSVKVDEPLPAIKGGIVEEPERVTLAILHKDEVLIADLLSSYATYTNDALIKIITDEQRAIVNGQILQLEAKMSVLRIDALEKRQAEIARLSEDNIKREKELKNQIDATLAKAVADTKDRIIQIRESRSVAESLGIIYPTDLKEIKENDSQGDRLQTLIKVNDNESLPLFLMGTRYLDSLVASINSRENEAAFVGELNELRKQITIVKNDAKLVALTSRVSDDPYIPEMPTIKSKIAELKSLSLDFSDARLYTLEKAPLVTGSHVKPKRNLIAVFGAGLSCFIAVLVALILNMKQRLEDRR